MSAGQIIDEISGLEHFRHLTCSNCQTSVRYHVLQIYAYCPKCSIRYKVRAFGGDGTEIQDVIDAVLKWVEAGEGLEAVLRRQEQIRKDVSVEEE